MLRLRCTTSAPPKTGPSHFPASAWGAPYTQRPIVVRLETQPLSWLDVSGRLSAAEIRLVPNDLTLINQLRGVSVPLCPSDLRIQARGSGERLRRRVHCREAKRPVSLHCIRLCLPGLRPALPPSS